MDREAYLAFERVAPDVLIVCGKPVVEDADVLLNPRTILEVLSPATEAFDRGQKAAGYRSIPSVEEIVFIYDGVEFERSGI